ncbi:MAG: lycopene cyclase family protein [Planctomycetota bacterium]
MIPTSVAIAGGGCAGLSLARSLVERFTEMRVTIIEPRESWQNDRTWCRWAFPDCRDEPATTHRWSRMRVRGGGFDKTLDIAGTPYVHIPAGAFTDGVVQQLRATGRCELRLGESVHGIGSHHDGATVSIGGEDTATPLRFDFVFDARPPERESLDGRRGLLQHFLGEEIRLERPVLDPETAIVMDFGVDQSEGLAFMYVLPFAPDRALFEATFLTPRLADQPDYQEMIRRYCEEELGSGIGESIREESGALPMTTGPLGPPATARVWPIGTRAGVGRASTGYAFDAIQRDSIRICDALSRGRPRPAPPTPRLLTTLDSMLISLLSRSPDRGPEVFGRLFSHAPRDALLRFLNDRGSAADMLAVAWAMPKRLMIGHLLRGRWKQA